MKIIKIKLLVIFLITFSIGAIISCEKSDNNYIKDEKQKTINENTKEAPVLGKIIIRRKHNWGIHMNYFDCDPGSGLCVSGDIPPEPIENTYEGILYKDPNSENHAVFFFSDEYIDAEDELIINGIFVIDIDVEIDEEMSNYIGFENPIMIKSGEYQVNQDEEGWNVVIVDIE